MSARKLLMKVKASHSQTSFHDSDSTRARLTAAVDVFNEADPVIFSRIVGGINLADVKEDVVTTVANEAKNPFPHRKICGHGDQS